MWQTVIVSAVLLAVVSSQKCVSRPSVATGEDAGHYCVCNATYCDDAPTLFRTNRQDSYIIITSTKAGLRFHVSQGVFGNIISVDRPIGSISLKPRMRYQPIIGFGGAVTDSVGVNINSLSEATGHRLVKSYFGQGGIEYSMIRTPMGGTDFSDRPYSYAMTPNDTLLKDFTLQAEDYKSKIPVIRKAVRMSKYPVKLLTAPWSSSPWMKTNNAWTNNGTLRPEYRQVWANYFVKYFQAYRREGFEFWGLTPQNEPEISTYLHVDINGITWTREALRDFVVGYLAPTLKRANLGYLKIFLGDDNRHTLPLIAETMMNDTKSRSIFAGTAVHWYFDNTIPPSRLDETKKAFPEKLIIYTEACAGVNADLSQKVILGSWQRGEAYARDIIENLNHWVSSWIDWNVALNLEGGPTYISNFVDAPIIVNATGDEFYKQPMYYALGHFSKYIPPGSIRIGSKAENLAGVDHVALVTPDNSLVVVFLNKNDEATEVVLKDPRKGSTRLVLPPKSINTMTYW